MPQRFNLVAGHIQEPDKLTGEQGYIFLWVTEFHGGLRDSEPRAYKLPFNAELHTRIVTATAKLRKGLPQLGEVEALDEAPKGRPVDPRQGGTGQCQSEVL